MLLFWSIGPVIWSFVVLPPFCVVLTRQIYLNLYFLSIFSNSVKFFSLIPLLNPCLFLPEEMMHFFLISWGIFASDPFWNLMEPMNLLAFLRDSISHLNDPCISVLARHCYNLFNNSIIFFPIRRTLITFLTCIKNSRTFESQNYYEKILFSLESLSLKDNIKKSNWRQSIRLE